MEHLDKIKKLLLKELEEFAARDKIEGFEDLEVIHKLTDTVKNICKIEMLHKQGGDGGYSGGNYGGGVYGGGYSYTGEVWMVGGKVRDCVAVRTTVVDERALVAVAPKIRAPDCVCRRHVGQKKAVERHTGIYFLPRLSGRLRYCADGAVSDHAPRRIRVVRLIHSHASIVS